MAKPSKVLGVAAWGGRHGVPRYPAGVGCLQPGGKGKVCILENNKVVQQRIKFFSYNRNAVMAKPPEVLGVAAGGGRHGVPQYPAGVGCSRQGRPARSAAVPRRGRLLAAGGLKERFVYLETTKLFSSIQTPVDRNDFTVDIRCFR